MPSLRTVPVTRKPGMSGRMMNAVGRCTRFAAPLDRRLRERRDHAGALPVADPLLAAVENPV